MLFTKRGNRKIRQFGRDIIYGRRRYNPNSQQTLNDLGNQMITSIVITRKPVDKPIQFILNTFGNASEELFHLCLNVTLDNGARVMVEKKPIAKY